jgi:hypothetical protein
MFMLAGLLCFLVLLACLFAVRERRLRIAWQHFTARILSRKEPDETPDDFPARGPRAGHHQ